MSLESHFKRPCRAAATRNSLCPSELQSTAYSNQPSRICVRGCRFPGKAVNGRHRDWHVQCEDAAGATGTRMGAGGSPRAMPDAESVLSENNASITNDKPIGLFRYGLVRVCT